MVLVTVGNGYDVKTLDICINIVLAELLTITLTEVGSKKREEIRKQTESITERKILTYGRSFGVVGKCVGVP